MKKGFTLVELLGVIVILGIISLIVVPPIINQIRTIRTSVGDDTLKLIYASTRRYMDDNRDQYPLIEDREYCITLRQLFNSGILPSPLLDPNTNEEISELKEVKIKINEIDNIEYELLNQGKCGYIDPSGASRPELVEGMLPIMYDEEQDTWVKADLNSRWYDYSDKMWANAALLTATSRGYYQNISPGEEVDDEDVLAYFVWIPRYRYRILNSSFSAMAYEDVMFDVIFEGISTEKSLGNLENEWLTHPAFSFGEDELNGLWVGKYTTGFEGATTAAEGVVSSPELDSAIIKPNSIMWRGIELSKAFVVARDFNEHGNIYGLNGDEAESRLLRNIDWGAVVYLSRSVYGSDEQIWSNRNNSFLTGCASDSALGPANSDCNQYNSENGQKTSTTGNVYGVYDMAGGAYEYVMAGVKTSGNESLRISQSGFTSDEESASELSPNINNPSLEPLIDKYDFNDDIEDFSHSKLGDALGETFNWEDALMVAARGDHDNSWYVRGGLNSLDPGASIFSFTAVNGGASSSRGFRIAIHNK